MKKINVMLATALLTSALTVKVSAAESEKNYLFIQTAGEATLAKIKDKPGSYELTLAHVNKDVEYFTDRPVRDAGKISLPDFLVKWHKIFGKIPPNVGVVGLKSVSEDNATTNLVLELSNPTYHQEKQTLTYQAQLVSEQTKMPSTLVLNNVALFIDDYCASCAGKGF